MDLFCVPFDCTYLIARSESKTSFPPLSMLRSNIPTTNPIQTLQVLLPQTIILLPQTNIPLVQKNLIHVTNHAALPTTSIRNSQVSSGPTPVIIILPSPPLPRRRTRRSLSKYRPQRVSVTSSHSHGGTPTGGTASHAPSSSLSQLNLASPLSSSLSPSPLYLYVARIFRGPHTIQISSRHINDRLRLSEELEKEAAREQGGFCWRIGMG